MTDIFFPLLVLVAIIAAYDILRRQVGNAPPRDVDVLQAKIDAQAAELAEHKATFEGICSQWRAKVIELDRKCDSVVRDAKNEIAGSLAVVSDITKKGWR